MPVPSARMSEGVVQMRLVAQTQGRPYLVYLLRFLILASVTPGSRGTKPKLFALEPATLQIRIIQPEIEYFTCFYKIHVFTKFSLKMSKTCYSNLILPKNNYSYLKRPTISSSFQPFCQYAQQHHRHPLRRWGAGDQFFPLFRLFRFPTF